MTKITRCLNTQKKIYAFKTGVWICGAILGVFGIVIFGFWGGVALSFVGAVLGSYIHDLVHFGSLQKFCYWYLPVMRFFKKSPKSENRLLF